MPFIYHIARFSDWELARQAGEYLGSTRGRSLDDVGFIHASAADQVAPVANAVYRDYGGSAGGGSDRLVVLVIDADKVTAQIRYEAVPGAPKPYPHIYGPLNADAVVEVLPLERGRNGDFQFVEAQAAPDPLGPPRSSDPPR